jgi:hypothetical protein
MKKENSYQNSQRNQSSNILDNDSENKYNTFHLLAYNYLQEGILNYKENAYEHALENFKKVNKIVTALDQKYGNEPFYKNQIDKFFNTLKGYLELTQKKLIKTKDTKRPIYHLPSNSMNPNIIKTQITNLHNTVVYQDKIIQNAIIDQSKSIQHNSESVVKNNEVILNNKNFYHSANEHKENFSINNTNKTNFTSNNGNIISNIPNTSIPNMSNNNIYTNLNFNVKQELQSKFQLHPQPTLNKSKSEVNFHSNFKQKYDSEFSKVLMGKTIIEEKCNVNENLQSFTKNKLVSDKEPEKNPHFLKTNEIFRNTSRKLSELK